ncbi:MAG: GTP 3',8-cyclase MoaA [SAR86 cluster bacterium]|uniref:GTP 3',8-cyclase n=1 Tax=SAR86 cluster bacterium TaxID=2030880 RepID=A0A2A5CC15_9GAMM|nr:GTP 3',8-cyclase MoaA [Gammaproteobacteria bacterium AH-315-E17]PCJ41434.1 MAG: GTP 3',8-cyclase MoaA [SAR86 cluster bacterium]
MSDITTDPTIDSTTDPAIGLIDKHGRHIDYVRLSLTDRCDFRCVYCMSEEMTFLPRNQILSLEEIYKVAQAFTELGVNKIRLTGGEPLIRNNVMSLIKDIGQLPGLDELLLTTNGSQLEKLAGPLREAGVNRINISLDSLNAEKFKTMTRTGKLKQVLKGVETAVAAGFDSIRLNAVVLRGVNDHEIIDLLEYAMGLGINIAYIEEMPLGNINDHERQDTVFSNEEVKELILERYAISPIDMSTAGPSRYYQVEGQRTKVGFISPVSHNFCESCNRVRVTVEGRLLLCLGNEYSTDLRQLLRDQPENIELLKQTIVKSMDIKPLRHYFYDEEQPQIVRFMNMTGG